MAQTQATRGGARSPVGGHAGLAAAAKRLAGRALGRLALHPQLLPRPRPERGLRRGGPSVKAVAAAERRLYRHRGGASSGAARALPVRNVAATASRLANACIITAPVSAFCAIATTSPLSSHFSASSAWTRRRRGRRQPYERESSQTHMRRTWPELRSRSRDSNGAKDMDGNAPRP